MPELKQSIRIQAPLQTVFDSLTVATGLREWFCDRAFCQLHAKGRYWMRWDDGERVEGSYLHVSPPHSVSFTWRAPSLPGQTTVRLVLEKVDDGVELSLTQVGFGSDSEWELARAECAMRWELGLANLRSTLEHGIDLRDANRPSLGIRWRMDEGGGIQVLGTIEGSDAADDAGFEPGDIIVAIGDAEVSGYASMVSALDECSPGRMVDVRVVRDGQVEVLPVLLGTAMRSEREQPPTNVGAGIRDRQIRMQRKISDVLAGIDQGEASRRPSPDEWCVLEILAHLSATERALHHRLAQIVMRSWDDTPVGNAAELPEVMAATLARTGTVSSLLDRFAQDQAETRAFLTSLRPEIRANKARYRRLVEAVDLSEHTRQHIDQIQSTLAELRRQKMEAEAGQREPQGESQTSE